MFELTWRAMGSSIRILLQAEDSRAAEQLQQAPQWFEDWEQRLSRFRPNSELNQLNRRPEQWVEVSKELWEVLDLALQAAQQTGGMLTPLVLPALEAAGYRNSFESSASWQASEIQTALPVSDWRLIRRKTAQRAVRLPAGVRLDLGGFGKGWAAQRSAERLAKWGPLVVDAGGDLAITAPLQNSQPWPVEITNPLNPGEALAQLHISQGGVATSGRDYRRWQRLGSEWHHLIDPRHGRPAQTDVLSASAVANDVRQAEVAAKQVLLLGSQAGLDWINQHPRLAALVVCENGQGLHSQQMPRFFRRLS